MYVIINIRNISKMKYKLINIYLDDDINNRPTPKGFKRFTGSYELLAYLNQHPNLHINALSLDNDLGVNQLEGYDLVKKLVERHIHVNYYLIHTANIIARQKIVTYLSNAMKNDMIADAPIKIINLTSRNDYERYYQKYQA